MIIITTLSGNFNVGIILLIYTQQQNPNKLQIILRGLIFEEYEKYALNYNFQITFNIQSHATNRSKILIKINATENTWTEQQCFTQHALKHEHALKNRNKKCIKLILLDQKKK